MADYARVGSSASCASCTHTCANPATTSIGTSFERSLRGSHASQIRPSLPNSRTVLTQPLGADRASRQLRPLFFVSASLTSSTDAAIVVLRQLGRRLECRPLIRLS